MLPTAKKKHNSINVNTIMEEAFRMEKKIPNTVIVVKQIALVYQCQVLQICIYILRNTILHFFVRLVSNTRFSRKYNSVTIYICYSFHRIIYFCA